MTPNAAFWDRVAQRYAKAKISDPVAYRETLDRSIAHLTPTDRVLELGCGTGSTALELAPHVGHITATDFAPAMIQIGRDKAADAGLDNIAFQVAEADDPTLATEAPFDAVLAFNMLHLLDDQSATLAHTHALLKPGGVLISKTPCLGERWFFRPLVSGLQWIGKAPQMHMQRQAALRSAMAEAGFEIVEDLMQTGAVPRLYLVARRA